jgi:cytochrome c oxidase subunit 3
MVESQFEDAIQQKESAILGMWVFLATEVLFFGGLFLTYAFYRSAYPGIFSRAGKELDVIIGTINTAVLLTSSYFVAMAVEAAERGRIKATSRYLAGSVGLGLIFLALKAKEYAEDFHKHLVPDQTFFRTGPDAPVMKLFFSIYFVMTALHAVHVTIGVGVLGTIYRRTQAGRYSAQDHNAVEIAGLYWHFVDLIWIFLYPLLYLMGRSK